MTIDWKKIGMWSGIAGVAGVVGYWLYQYQLTAAANSAAQAATDSQNENQALAALMEQPLSSGGTTDSSASVSGPTVDTGNNTLQALIESILNPPVAATTAPVATTPSTPVATTPSDTSQPIGDGGNTTVATTGGPVQATNGPVGSSTLSGTNSDAPIITTSPGQLITLPVATILVQ
jgi:hypothetical protein